MSIEEQIRHIAKNEVMTAITILREDLTNDYFANKIENDLYKAGQSWAAEEDRILAHELATAIACIARTHGRTVTAIRCRIQQRDLISGNV